MTDRRSFLRGLATLPLIGGSGQPTRAAMPALMTRYVAWLAAEHGSALIALDELCHPHLIGTRFMVRDWRRRELHWFPDEPEAYAAVAAGSPLDRAPIVLSAAGCSLTGERST